MLFGAPGILSFFSSVAEEECPQHFGGWVVFRPEMIDGQEKKCLYREVGEMMSTVDSKAVAVVTEETEGAAC